MSMYNMREFVNDFADRTIANIQNVEQHNTGQKFYEVTQLINSLLGLVVIPFESVDRITRNRENQNRNWSKFNKRLNESSSEDCAQLINLLKKCNNEHRLYSTYKGEPVEYFIKGPAKFIMHLRNSISHSGRQNIYFFPLEGIDSSNSIQGVIFHDTWTEKPSQDNNYTEKQYDFYLAVSISELRKMVILIANMMKNIKLDSTSFKQYNDDIDNWLKAMGQTKHQLQELLTKEQNNYGN